MKITFSSVVPKEASDVANAVAWRYKTVRDMTADQEFATKARVLVREIAEQQKIVAQKPATLDRTQQDALDSLLLRQSQMKAEHALKPSPVLILTLADPSEYPSHPDHKVNTLIAIAVGIPLAAIAATLVEFACWYVARFSPPGTPPAFLSAPAAPSADY